MSMPSYFLSITTLIKVILLSLASHNSRVRAGTFSAPITSFPEKITLRAGVLHAEPFASVNNDGTFTGFQPDLLERLKIFAQDDGVELEFDLQAAPPQYGTALDMLANDCNTTSNPFPLEECTKFDLIVGDYYCNPSRSLRVKLSASWLRSTISTLKAVNNDNNNNGPEVTTLSQASKAGATVCNLEGAYYTTLVKAAHPGAKYLSCPNQQECIEVLKQGKCVLYPDDELQLKYRAVLDPSIELTREQFNTQYIVWPMTYRLPDITRALLDKWIYSAVSNATLDELYFNYFEAQYCPFGTSGSLPNCENYCHPEHGSANLQGDCVCESIKWTGADCATEVLENPHLIPPALKVFGYCMFGINCVAVLVCAVWLFVKRNTIQVKVMQPFFLALVLVGCFISSSTLVALADESAGGGPVHGCMAMPWLYSVGFSITFGTLFAKIRRVNIMFKAAVTMRRVQVTIRETLFVIGGVLMVDVAILTVWTVISPLTWNRVVLLADKFGETVESVGFCTSKNWRIFGSLIAALHFCLLGIACYLCYQTRNISTRFSESKYLAIAMVSNLQVFVVGLPVLVIVGTDPETSFFVRSVIIWVNDLMVVTLIFGNLMWSVYTKPEESIKDTIQSAQRKYNSKHSLRSNNNSQVDVTSNAEFTGQTLDDTGKSLYRMSQISTMEKIDEEQHVVETDDVNVEWSTNIYMNSRSDSSSDGASISAAYRLEITGEIIPAKPPLRE